jgi:hypothetical protein
VADRPTHSTDCPNAARHAEDTKGGESGEGGAGAVSHNDTESLLGGVLQHGRSAVTDVTQ